MIEEPINVFDLETTGLNVDTDRIISLSVITLTPSGDGLLRAPAVNMEFNPGIPISAEAAAIHGYTDEMVRDLPPFSSQAARLHGIFKQGYTAGYNIRRFDTAILSNELGRCGYPWPGSPLKIIDIYRVFTQMEKQDLAGALKFYTGRQIENAHNAEADTNAAADVLCAQFDKYGIPADEMVDMSVSGIVDFAGKFAVQDGVAIFAFGKHKGSPVAHHLDFVKWMHGKDFTANTKAWCRYFLQNAGRMPE